MKTVIQQLIEQLEKTIPEVKNGNAIDKLFWLEKEKQQIIEAVKYSFADAHKPNSDINFIHYYEKTFNTTNKETLK